MEFTKGMVILGRYKIISTLGKGGFGAVYLAEDFLLKSKPVAIKVTNNDTIDQMEKNRTLDQFMLEASILANLSHPHLPKVDNFGDLDQFLFMVMDYIPGDNLQVKLNAQGAMSESEVLPIMDQVLDALTYTHGQKPPVIHRDIKPANIVVRKDGMAFLVDFGIAKIDRTLTGAKAYTPHFAPPEQHGTGTDPRSDIYSLGATLYALLTGQAPTESIERVQGTSLTSPRQIKPSISSITEKIILKAMSLTPEDRYQTAQEFRSALMGTLPAAGVQPQPISVKPPAAKPVAVAAPKPQPKVAGGNDIIVAADGSGQYKTINEGIGSIKNDGKVIVKAGLYRESIIISSDTVIVGDSESGEVVLEAASDKPAIIMESKYHNLTLQNLTIRSTSAHAECVRITGGSCTILDCVLTGGISVIFLADCRANISSSKIHTGRVFGIAIKNSSELRMINTEVYNNGEIGLFAGEGTYLNISKCSFRNNSRCGITCSGDCYGKIEKCDIFDNLESGAWIGGRTITMFIQCNFAGNVHGITILGNSEPKIESCKISKNSRCGVYIDDNAEPVIIDGTIDCNGEWGIVCTGKSRPSFTNCTSSNHLKSNYSVTDSSIPVLTKCKFN